MEERFADNVPWGYHLIPFVTGLIGLFVGGYQRFRTSKEDRTSFPPTCLIVGGFGGLVVLGNISDRFRGA